MKRHLPVNKTIPPINKNHPCKANIPPLYGNSSEFPENAILEKELELELIQTQMAQKPMLRAEVGMRVRCANKASAE